MKHRTAIMLSYLSCQQVLLTEITKDTVLPGSTDISEDRYNSPELVIVGRILATFCTATDIFVRPYFWLPTQWLSCLHIQVLTACVQVVRKPKFSGHKNETYKEIISIAGRKILGTNEHSKTECTRVLDWKGRDDVKFYFPNASAVHAVDLPCSFVSPPGADTHCRLVM